jgi:cytochrome P450
MSAEYDPFDLTARQDPYPWLREQRAQDPVFFSPTFGMWVVTRYADAEEVLKQPAVFSSENALVGRYHPQVSAKFEGKVPLTATLIGMDRPDHTRLRRIVNRAFTPKRVAQMEDDVRRTVVELLDDLPADQPFDLVGDFSYPLTLRVIAGLVGIPRDDIPACHALSERWNALMGADERGVPLEEQLAMADDALAYHRRISELIAEREHAPADDLITAVWDVRRKGDVELSDIEMLSLFPGLISAGHETTANLIGNGMFQMLHQRERWEGLVAGRYDVPDLIEEMLRYDTSIFGLPRRVTEDTRIGDVEIPEGDLVFVHFAAAGHDPAQFSDPDQFVPSRGAVQHLAFGRGAHFCPGAPLARLESRIALEELVARRPDLRIAGDVTYNPHFVFRGLTALPVIG